MFEGNFSQQHEMHLAKTHPSGAQEWVCPECARRFLLQFHPENNKIELFVLEEGDASVGHAGTTGEARLHISEIREIDGEPDLPEELRLALEEALKDVNFDNWESKED